MSTRTASGIQLIEAPGAGAGRRRGASLLRILGAARELSRQGPLLRELTVRAIRDRYRASYLGLLWALLNPLILLAVYTVVFATIFTPRFSEASRSPYEFGVILFSALIPFNFFVEAIAAAPFLIVSQVSYVKRVVFPLQALPLVSALVGLVNAGISLVLFALAARAVRGGVPSLALSLPLVWVPLITVTLGLSYLLAALGVFLRDLGQVIGPLLSALFFLSPVFYPATAMPEVIRPFYWMNPLGVVIENTRRVLVTGAAPEWGLLAAWSAGGVVLLCLGFAVFVRSRWAFNDVL